MPIFSRHADHRECGISRGQLDNSDVRYSTFAKRPIHPALRIANAVRALRPGGTFDNGGEVCDKITGFVSRHIPDD